MCIVLAKSGKSFEVAFAHIPPALYGLPRLIDLPICNFIVKGTTKFKVVGHNLQGDLVYCIRQTC